MKASVDTWFSGLPGLWVQDGACQSGIQPIFDRTKEHLGSSDTGIAMTRRLLLEAVSAYRDRGIKPNGVDQSRHVHGARGLADAAGKHVMGRIRPAAHAAQGSAPVSAMRRRAHPETRAMRKIQPSMAASRFGSIAADAPSTVPAGETILDILLDAGIDASFSCTEGHCGTCETKVIEGIPDHRDSFLERRGKGREQQDHDLLLAVEIAGSGARPLEWPLDRALGSSQHPCREQRSVAVVENDDLDRRIKPRFDIGQYPRRNPNSLVQVDDADPIGNFFPNTAGAACTTVCE